MQTKINLFLLLVLTFLSCRRENKITNVIDLLAPVKSEIINLSDIATDINFIPLQTSDSSLIQRRNYFIAKGDYIYFRNMFEILCFDKSGKYLFKLNKSGRGPGEYEILFDFDVNSKNTLLAVRSLTSILLYKQTDNGFEFMTKLSFPATPSKISFTGESNSIMLQNSSGDGTKPYSMELINLKGQSLITRPNYLKYSLKDNYISSSNYEVTSYCIGSSLFLKDVMNDTLFRLKEDKTLEPYLIFDTKDKRLTPELRSNGKYYSSHSYEYFQVFKIFASERYVCYSYSYNKKYGQMVIYDKITKNKYSVSDKVFLKDDIGGGVNFEPQYCNDGIFYASVDALSLKKYVSSEMFENVKVKNPKKKIALRKLADELTEFDNPVLILAKVK